MYDKVDDHQQQCDVAVSLEQAHQHDDFFRDKTSNSKYVACNKKNSYNFLQ